MADNLSIDTNQQHQQQLYYSIVRLNNSDNTLNAWMRHILSYLTSSERHHNNNNHYLGLHQLRRNHNHDHDGDDDPPQRPELQLRLQVQMQEPHVAQGAVCDGSSDCQSNLWAHEVSYEQHYRKLLMSRVNAGDTNQVNSVDQESLRREASLVMESVDPARPPQQPALARDQNANAAGADDANTPMDVESFSDGRYSDWDFVMYDSDVESSDDSSDDPTYEISESDLIKLEDDYTSASDDDTDYDSDPTSETYELISTASLRYDEGYSSGNSDRTSKYRRVSRNVAGAGGRIDTDTDSSVFEYYYCSSEDDSEEYVRTESEWEDMSSSN